tara:strand:+ start:161 stop:910 length:750 start_codon:yes stop_codon:yes gene_type:complete
MNYLFSRNRNENSTDDNVELVPIRTHSDSEDLTNDFIPHSYKKTRLESLLKFILHICVHISMLSVLEMLLFFYYIVVIEKKVFFRQLEKFLNNLSPIIEKNSFTIRNEPAYQVIIELLKQDQLSLVYDYNLMQEKSIADMDSINKSNHLLFNKALFFSIIMSSTTVLYYIIFQLVYKKKLLIFKLLGKHLGLMFFIGLFELWFFQNIIIQYNPWSESQVSFYIFQCFMKNVIYYYPELKFVLPDQELSC